MSPAEPAAASKPVLKSWADFQWDDPFLLEDQLSEEERMVRDTARAYCQEKLMPRVLEAYPPRALRPRDHRTRWARSACSGSTIEGYGCAGVNYVSYGLIAREVERVDSALPLGMSVQSTLVMYPIHAYGTEAQRQKYLPQARDRRVGRLLRPDRARPRLRPRRHEDAARARSPAAIGSRARRCGSPTRRSPTSSWCGPKTMTGDDPRLHPGEGHEGPHRAEDRGQVLAARLASPARS